MGTLHEGGDSLDQQTASVTFGCLLHDLGKLCYRAGSSGTHSESGYAFLKQLWQEPEILDCLRWHHAAELRKGNPPKDSLAFIACIADNISAAADRRAAQEEGHFERYLPLSPVFTHLNGQHPGKALPLAPQNGTLRMPVSGEAARTDAAAYAGILREIQTQLKGLPPQAEWLDSLLVLLESYTSAVPSSTNTGESPDISLFDHLKITAAVGSCISVYLEDQGIRDYQAELMEHENAFRKKEAFLLYSADFSGIQRFIYTVSTKGALKALRSRSFFLEMTMEHYIDELLGLCGVSRANLLYSGGGHCYVLLPNTENVKQCLERWNLRFNNWLSEQFGTVLYLADGFTPCSANDLTNTPTEAEPYKAMFRRVSSAVAKKKLHRYSAQQIIQMNRLEENLSGQECRVCGRTDHLTSVDDGTSLCPWCATFEQISGAIQRNSVFLVTDGADRKAAFSLPTPENAASFYLTNEGQARAALADGQNVRRIYTKNVAYAGLKYSTRIYVGDYAASNSLQDLASGSDGIRRLAVCRMDLDNLGQAFVSGFENADGTNAAERQRYVTISRTAAFSRQMSLFFKCYINPLLSGEYAARKPLQVTIVYSGGDDVFLVGAWNDTMEAARRIRNALKEYSCGSLTLSGGIGLFDDHHPIRQAAAQTELLESDAKAYPQKNAVSLFTPDASHTYNWDNFEKDVLGEKLSELNRFFSGDTKGRGTAFLYHILDLLRQAQSDPAEKMPLARIAFLLSRLEPLGNAHYKTFSQNMIRWSVNANDRRSLITAIYLHVYANRKGGNQYG